MSRSTAIEACALGLGVVCLAAGLAAQGGRVSPALDLLTHFAPFWLAGALAVVVQGCLFARRGRRAATIIVGVLGAIAAGVLIAPEYRRPIPTSAPGARTLRVIQFNTWDETLDPAISADWVARERPDIVVVEEVEPPIEAALLARGFFSSIGPGNVGVFSRAKPVDGWTPLSPAEWHEMPPFARVTFGSGAGRYTVVAVHLPEPYHRVAGAERRMLATFLSRYDRDHLIVAGDFNLTPWSFALRGLDRALALPRLDRAQFSWPGQLSLAGRRVAAIPVLPIDHIYAGSAWRLVSLKRGPALGSDHFPLVVVLSEKGAM